MSSPFLRARRLAPLLLALALLVVAARPVTAQPAGQVRGVALRAEDGAPIAFALVRLLRVEPGAAPDAPAVVQQAITGANGHFAVGDLPPGAYRLQLARIGYEPVLSPVLQLAAGQTLQHELRGASRALRLATVTVRPDAGCLTIARIGDDERLATLWQEARKGIETRLAFERRYRYTRISRQDGVVRFRLFRRAIHTVDTARSEPDSVEARRQRRIAELRAQGHKAADGRLTIPNERDLLDEEYMREQCLAVVAADAADTARAGAVGLRFRPVRPRRDGVVVDGTLWLDARTFLARGLDVRWTRGDDPFGQASVQYGDVAVDGSSLRLPVAAQASVKPAAIVAKAIVSGASSTLALRYLDFEQVGPR